MLFRSIQRRGKADNFWSMGVPGPCGPCSEILYDLGPEYGAEGDWTNGDRYMELWNLVFMQYERGEGPGKEGYPILGELPARNIDTGMGLERVAYLLQGVDNLYENDQVRPVLDKAVELSGRRYGADYQTDVRLRIVADHVRSALMIVSDGVTPSNEARGYVLRRIIRRAVNQMRLLGVDEPTMPELLPVSQARMKQSYPELEQEWPRISSVIYNEEEAFLSTLKTGTQIFDLAVEETKRSGGTVLAGEKAFQLHDTYGFPIDLTLEMAAEAGLTVDEQGFRRLMDEQRARAKADAAKHKVGHGDASVYRAVLDTAGTSEFLGYTDLAAEGRVVGLVVDGAGVPAAGTGSAVEVILDRTPFYAEGGGQLADTGWIRGDGFTIEVSDVQSPVTGLIVHRGTVTEGEARVDATVHAEVDTARRAAVSRSHSATHLVHAGMRKHLGDAAAQAGSLNAPGRLRFDFTSPGGAVPASVLADVEDEVNAVLQNDEEVRWFVTSQDEARKLGALALFGEKYGDKVRIVEIGDYSRELCGGTHVHRSGQLGLVKLLSESSIGSGVRRVEALVGLDAFRYLAKEHVLVSQLAEQFKARPEELPERIGGIVERLRQAERELEKVRAEAVLSSAGALADGAEDVDGIALVAVAAPEGVSGNDLRALASDVRGRLGARPGVVALFSAAGEKVSFVVATTAAARERGLAAGKLIPEFAPAVGGRGGGKPDLAQGGGTNPAGIPDAIAALRAAIRA